MTRQQKLALIEVIGTAGAQLSGSATPSLEFRSHLPEQLLFVKLVGIVAHRGGLNLIPYALHKILVVVPQSHLQPHYVPIAGTFGGRLGFLLLSSQDSRVEQGLENLAQIVRPMEEEFIEEVGHDI